MCLSFVFVMVSILRIFRSMIKISVITFGTLILWIYKKYQINIDEYFDKIM